MPKPFNAYHKWLCIPPSNLPVDCYQLLGLARFEDDPEVIRAAAKQRAAPLETHLTGPRGETVRELQSRLAIAANWLLNARRRPPTTSGSARRSVPGNAVVPPPVVIESEPDVAALIGVDSKPGPRHFLRRERAPLAWLSWRSSAGPGPS